MKALQHFILITRHRHKVIKHAFKCGIGFQGLFHDLSKYSFAEFIPSSKHFLGNKSPNEGERYDYGYSKAWLHHKGRNKHHFEYWFDVSPITHKYEPVKMPLKYVKEMFCDRLAATKIYKKDQYTSSSAYDYYIHGNAKSMMHPETSALLEKWLLMIRDTSEEATFKEIKNTISY